MPLQIAAKVDPVDRDYFEHAIAPLLQDPLVEFIGEIGENEKSRFLGDAVALLFPIDWPEPFGLVLIEAMATGTPVIAFGRGSVPEIIEDGLTGFIVDDVARGGGRGAAGEAARPRSDPAAFRGALHGRPHGARLSGALSARAARHCVS